MVDSWGLKIGWKFFYGFGVGYDFVEVLLLNGNLTGEIFILQVLWKLDFAGNFRF